MGSGGYYSCSQCGFRSDEIWFGGGFIGNDRNPVVRDEILDGEYGTEPKKILESEPDVHFYGQMDAFRCRCGKFSSKSTVMIFSAEGKQLYAPTMNCELCGKRMRRLRNPGGKQDCPKCGMQLDFYSTVCWD